jgi:O-antigen/teichoic acid export membrane protein
MSWREYHTMPRRPTSLVTYLKSVLYSASSPHARLTSATAWSVLSTVISQGQGLLVALISAHLLGKQRFGELGIINSTLSTAGIVAGFGLGLTATKYTAQLRVNDPDRAGRIVGLSLAVSVGLGGAIGLLLFTLSPLLALKSLGAPHLTSSLRLGCVLLFCNALNGTQLGALAGVEAFRDIARLNVIRALISLAVTVPAVWLFGVAGAVAAMVITVACLCVLAGRQLLAACNLAGVIIRYRGLTEEWRVLARFSLPAFLSGLMAGQFVWLANTILARQPGGYGEIALLSAAGQWRTLIFTLPNILCSAALPILSSEQTNQDTYRSVMGITQSLSILVAVPLGTFVMFISDPLMRMYGRGFVDGGPVLIGVALGITISAIGSAMGSAIAARGLMWFGGLQNLSWGAILLAFVAYGGSRWGARAFALGFAVAYLFLALWSYIYFKADLPPRMFRRTLWAVGYIGVLGFVSAAIGPSARLWLAAPACFLSCIVSVFLVRDSLPSRFRPPSLIPAMALLGETDID